MEYLWLVFPGMFVGMIVALWFHQRKRRENSVADDEFDFQFGAMPTEEPQQFPVGTRVRHTLWGDYGTVAPQERLNCDEGCCTSEGKPVVAWDDDAMDAYRCSPEYLEIVK